MTFLLSLLVACNEQPEATPQAAKTLTLAAYTTPREAYGKAILPAFAKAWKEKTGEDVKFEESYQGSGAQARAVKEGFEADVVALSLEPDVMVLEEAGLITHSWRTTGMVSRSIAVIAVRKGNPKNIQDWNDLARADIEVLTPNVRTSGGAMWNVLAIWGAALRGHAGTDPASAISLLSGVLGRVSVMDKGARESMVTFEKGVGDAAITYENEVLVAQKEGQSMDYVVPSSTILIENPIAVVDSYAEKHGNQAIAQAFVDFCLGPDAQRALMEYGLRSIDPSIPSNLPVPPDLFTIQDLGGWAKVKAEIFAKDAAYDQALAAKK